LSLDPSGAQTSAHPFHPSRVGNAGGGLIQKLSSADTFQQGLEMLRKNSLNGARVQKNHPAGVKTRLIWADYGTDESVPFQNGGSDGVFPQPLETGDSIHVRLSRNAC